MKKWILTLTLMAAASHAGEYWHRALERKPLVLMVLALVAVSIGGLVEIIPTALVKSNIPTISSVKPYTPLELEGRDIYIDRKSVV